MLGEPLVNGRLACKSLLQKGYAWGVIYFLGMEIIGRGSVVKQLPNTALDNKRATPAFLGLDE